MFWRENQKGEYMEFFKFIFSSFWIWLGFLILMSTFLYYIVNGIIRVTQALKGKSFQSNIGDSNDVWTNCNDKLPTIDGLYYVKKDNTNSMYLCRFENEKFTLSAYPDHEMKAIKWADYGAFDSE